MNESNQKRNNYIVLGEASYINGEKEKAVEFYKKALEYDGNNDIDIYFNLAIIYDELDLVDESISSYQKIIDKDKKQAGAFYGKAIMLERKGLIDEALDNYLEAIKIDPKYDRAYYFAANLYDIKGDFDNAIKYYEKVLTLKPDD
ncbi:MAG TPA: tetratricopeptide repeat protein, partial [Tissierellaceae bacterium]